MNMKYNFVIFATEAELYKISYGDVIKRDDVLYITSERDYLNRLEYALFRCHYTHLINKHIELPFKNLWARKLFKNPFKDNKPICFLFFSGWIRLLGINLPAYLKKTYPGSKCVWFLQDLYDKQICTNGKNINLAVMRRELDLILSFDQADCNKYGFNYHPLVFSAFEDTIKAREKSDVYFIGKAKDRLDDILLVYSRLKSLGVKCDFHIAGVKQSKRKFANEIDYTPQISYKQNLEHIANTKCILEIMQEGGVGFTQRGCEAVCMNKLLLTNNPMIQSEPFYTSKYIMNFKNVEDIDSSIAENIKNAKGIDYKYKEHFSPVELLRFIENNV